MLVLLVLLIACPLPDGGPYDVPLDGPAPIVPGSDGAVPPAPVPVLPEAPVPVSDGAIPPAPVPAPVVPGPEVHPLD